MRSTSRLTRGKKRAIASGSQSVSTIVSIIKLIDESGVRSSCDTFETKSRRVSSSSCKRVSSLAITSTPPLPSSGSVATVKTRVPAGRASESRPRDGCPARASLTRRSSSKDGITSMIARPMIGREPNSKIAAAAALSDRT